MAPSQRGPTQPIHELVPGMVVNGDYRVVERLGAGGMAVVYEVVNIHTGHRSALKTPLNTVHGDARAQFTQEGSIHFQLPSQVHIVAPQHFGTLPDGRPFLIMALIKGLTLDRWLERGSALWLDDGLQSKRLPLALALRFGMQLASGLDAAHSSKPPIIHRDLKPANIFVDEENLVEVSLKSVPKLLITDFGLAYSNTSGHQAMHAGTAGYLSPEQLLRATPTARSDLYTLGVILFELIEQKQIFGSIDTQAFFDATLKDERAELSNRYPAELVALVKSMVQRDPNLRPYSAGEVRTKLSSVLEQIEGRREGTQADFDARSYQASVSKTILLPVPKGGAVSRISSASLDLPSPDRRPLFALLAVVVFAASAGVVLFKGKAAPIASSAPQVISPAPGLNAPAPAPAIKEVTVVPEAIEPAPPTEQRRDDDLAPLLNPPKPVSAKSPVARAADCIPDEGWQRAMNVDLDATRDVVAKAADNALFAAFERAQTRALEKVIAAKTPAQCAAAQAEVDRVVNKFNP